MGPGHSCGACPRSHPPGQLGHLAFPERCTWLSARHPAGAQGVPAKRPWHVPREQTTSPHRVPVPRGGTAAPCVSGRAHSCPRSRTWMARPTHRHASRWGRAWTCGKEGSGGQMASPRAPGDQAPALRTLALPHQDKHPGEPRRHPGACFHFPQSVRWVSVRAPTAPETQPGLLQHLGDQVQPRTAHQGLTPSFSPPDCFNTESETRVPRHENRNNPLHASGASQQLYCMGFILNLSVGNRTYFMIFYPFYMQ